MASDPFRAHSARGRDASIILTSATSRPRSRLARIAVIAVEFATFVPGGASPQVRSPTAGMSAWPVGYGTTMVDERRDPWVMVTDAMVALLLTPAQRHVHRTRRITVDYDGDGVPDLVTMVCNSRQMGVLVRLGGSGRTVIAYRANGRWSDQQLYRIGGRTIGIEFPKSTTVILSSESGQPMVYYREEGGN